MKTVTFIPPTKRKKMNKARRTRIFLSRNGVCFVCRLQIHDGEPWIVEHPEAVNLGGSDDDADLWPAHETCRRKKDTVDRKLIADRNTKIDRGYAGKKPKRGFYRPPGTEFNWRTGRYERNPS